MHTILFFFVQFLGRIMYDKCSLYGISNLVCKINQRELQCFILYYRLLLGYSHSVTFMAATFSHVVKYDTTWLQRSTV